MSESQLIKEKILDGYIDYVLSEDAKPLSIYKFSKHLKIDDQEFYNYFGSFDQVEDYFWSQIVHQSMNLVKEEEVESVHHQILSFYFTLFENFRIHRSFILYLYGQKSNSFHFEFRLRKSVKPQLREFSKAMITPLHNISEEFGDKLSEEGMWLQFVALFNYWIRDESPGFEKTDLFIEKSVRLGVDLSKSFPSESILDFGKFIFKEIRSAV